MQESRPFGASATASKPDEQTGVSTTTIHTPLSALRTALRRRVSFLRAFIEVTLAGFLLTLIGYVIAPVFGSPWVELASYTSFLIYGFAGWRLEEGSGGFFRRLGRDLAFGVLMTVAIFVSSVLCFRLIGHNSTYFGIKLSDLDVTAAKLIFGSVLVAFSPYVLARTLIVLYEAGRKRLMWRLTYSYMIVTIVGVLLVISAQGLYVAVASLATAPTIIEPGAAAQRASLAIQPLVTQGAQSPQIQSTLQGLLDGTVRLPLPAGQQADFGNQPSSFAGVRRITMLDNSGTVLASVGRNAFVIGEPLPSSPADTNVALLAQARIQGCANGRPLSGPLADAAACGITGKSGAVSGVLLLETNTDGSFQFGLDLQRIFAIVLVDASSGVYLIFFSVLGLLLVAVGGGYLLSRRLTRRIEQLAAATGDLASGNRTMRVKVDSVDEVGSLSANFNTMAEKLAERETALTSERDRAERLLQANRRLVADVSHELRTPLTTLRGYIEVLEQEHAAVIPAHDLGVIQGEIGRLTSLIEDLFTLARAEAHQLPLTMEPVDVKALSERLAETAAPLARRDRQIEVVAALSDHLPPARADRSRLEQVILNLLQNALRYTLPGGIIAIEGSAQDGQVNLSVADTGIGIPPEELPLVFERFYRSDRSRARESGGAGIGLALVKELVSAMGGTVSVESTVGQGSRFTVTLPCA